MLIPNASSESPSSPRRPNAARSPIPATAGGRTSGSSTSVIRSPSPAEVARAEEVGDRSADDQDDHVRDDARLQADDAVPRARPRCRAADQIARRDAQEDGDEREQEEANAMRRPARAAIWNGLLTGARSPASWSALRRLVAEEEGRRTPGPARLASSLRPLRPDSEWAPGSRPGARSSAPSSPAALASVAYTKPASASPSATLLRTPFTSFSSLTTLVENARPCPSFLRVPRACSHRQGRPRRRSTSFTPFASHVRQRVDSCAVVFRDDQDEAVGREDLRLLDEVGPRRAASGYFVLAAA